MANRLTKIYTRTGDKGTTSLANGSKVNKYHPRIEALGDTDELNCLLGVLIAELTAQEPLRKLLLQCQNDLFDLGGELAVADPGYTVITNDVITQMEREIDSLNSQLPPSRSLSSRAATGLQRCAIRRAVSAVGQTDGLWNWRIRKRSIS